MKKPILTQLLIFICPFFLFTTQLFSSRTTAKILLDEYLKAFCCNEIGVCYGVRINTEKGIDVLEKPENIQKGLVNGKPTPWGYGSGIEDAPYQTATLLFSLCEAYDVSGDEVFYTAAKKIFKGMVLIGTVAATPGFIPRGPHPDGKSYYTDGCKFISWVNKTIKPAPVY